MNFNKFDWIALSVFVALAVSLILEIGEPVFDQEDVGRLFSWGHVMTATGMFFIPFLLGRWAGMRDR